jgi:hypothetical protein
MKPNHPEPSTQAVLLYPRSIEILANTLRSLKQKHSLSGITLLVVAHRADTIDYTALQSIVDGEFPGADNKIVTIPLKGMMQKSWSTLKKSLELEPAPLTHEADRKSKLKAITYHNREMIDHMASKLERMLLEMYCFHSGKVGFATKVSQSASAKKEPEIIEL